MSDDVDEFNFKLTHIDRASSLWLRLREQLEARLAMLRRKNDNNLNPEATAKLRGQIECLKSILDFGVDLPPIEDGGGESFTNTRERILRRAVRWRKKR